LRLNEFVKHLNKNLEYSLEIARRRKGVIEEEEEGSSSGYEI
jgi:hypothetical protein